MISVSTRRGQCLFCSFRALLAKPSRRPPHNVQRNVSVHAPRVRERSKPSYSRDGPAKPRSATALRLSPDVVWSRVRKCLISLKKDLSSTEASSNPDISQLAALDPTRKRWDDFKAKLEDFLNAGTGHKTPADEKLLLEIGHANQSSSWEEGLKRALHFGFIDYVIAKNVEEDLLSKSVIADLRYPTEWYSAARQTQRDVHLHIGPTNSGKTYNALKRLEESGNGFYAGPLRLLAHEVFSRFKAKGVPCDLVTGDDIRHDDAPNVTLYASTVEMVDVSSPVEVAVIDEIQMMASQDRGWAWTRAFLGANAKEVHLCGEARVLPLVRELTASTGDTLHVHEYQRLNPLKVMSKSLGGDLKSLRKGDCIVTFSVMKIHALKKQIELDTGRRCAIVYGSLPPETRAAQAALFNDPDSDYDFLVASDAIGMGLNLSVKRIIFHGVSKYNGRHHEQLSVPQIKQIGGRAGRYRSAHQAMTKSDKSKNAAEVSVGLVTTIMDEDLPIVRDAMRAQDPPIKVAGLLPPGDFMEDLAARLPEGVPFEYILRRLCESASMHPRFKMCSIRDQSRIAQVIEHVRGLNTSDRVVLTAAPCNGTSDELTAVMKTLAQCVADQRPVTIVDLPEINLEILENPVSGDREYLESLETLHKSLIMFLWLSYRFTAIFKDRDMAMHAKAMVEDKINTCLLEFSANPNLRKRILAYKKRMPTLSTAVDGDAMLETSGGLDTALPVDWTRGSSNGEFEDPQHAQSPLTTAA